MAKPESKPQTIKVPTPVVVDLNMDSQEKNSLINAAMGGEMDSSMSMGSAGGSSMSTMGSNYSYMAETGAEQEDFSASSVMYQQFAGNALY